MSALPTPVPDGQQWRAGKNDSQIVNALMKRMGSRKGYSPLPPAQHHWQRAKSEPPLYRVWSWMCDHTIYWGHRCEYAVNVHGEELHIEHLAKDLEMDLANARMTWREGLVKGLWRTGTKTEGKRKLYLCGEVIPQDKGEEEANEKVCTNLLPPYILKQIKEWAPERQREFHQRFANEQEVLKTGQAELVAALRAVSTQREDTLFGEFGVKKIREEHPGRKKDLELATARHQRLEVVAPVVERYVQTLAEFVQTRNSALNKPENSAAQTSASLLSRDYSETAQKEKASGHSGAPRRRVENPPDQGEKPVNQLPAPEMPELDTEEQREAEALLFSQIRQLQTGYPHTDFSRELISEKKRSDQLLVRRILAAVGSRNVMQFLLSVVARFKGLDREAMAKLPPRAPGMVGGPRSLGLILTWAQDYGRKLDDAAKAEEKISKKRRDREVAVCLEILREPETDVWEKDQAKETLKKYGVQSGGEL